MKRNNNDRKRRLSRPEKKSKAKRGSLVVIGTGIKTVGQLTMEAIAWIQEAEKLFYIVSDPVAESVMKNLNPKVTESLSVWYKEGKPRSEAYEKMVEQILKSVRSGKKTVVALYGHPGVFAYPSHESIRIARKEGYTAQMLPAISSEDCLFADLGIDPGDFGCQSYEATDFLLHSTIIDPSSHLILWQVGLVCDWTYRRGNYARKAIPLLVHKLARFYPLTHKVTVYEAARLPATNPIIKRISLGSLTNFPLTSGDTLYIPPIATKIPDVEMTLSFSRLAK
jgi:precorrin-6B methylase 1